MHSSTAEGTHAKGLIKTFVASGIQASASGGWITQDSHQDQEAVDALVEQLARKTVAENLHEVVGWLFLGKNERFDMADSKVKAIAAIVEGIVAQVGIDPGLKLYCNSLGL